MVDEKLLSELKKYFNAEVLTAKGGFFVKGHGFISISKARKLTNVVSEMKRQPKSKTGGYGDYAILRKIVGKM